jgi:hypothetical protein
MKKTITPELKRMAEAAIRWAASKEGQIAYERANQAGRDAVELMRKAQRSNPLYI